MEFFSKSPFNMVPDGGVLRKCTYFFEDAQEEMWYLLYTPAKYAGLQHSEQVPLLVALHGLHCNPTHIMNFDGLLSEADRRGYIVAAPMGYNSHAWYGCFKNVQKPTQDIPDGYRSEQDVLNVVNEVRSKHLIDPRRIYLTGHSMGGGGTIHLGAAYPMLWAALAPLSPALVFNNPEEKCKALQALPIFFVTGDSDPLIPIDGVRKWVGLLQSLGTTCKLLTLEGGDHLTPAYDAASIAQVFDFFDQHQQAVPAPRNVQPEPWPRCEGGSSAKAQSGLGGCLLSVVQKLCSRYTP
mmetsp:Transcript_44669/g.103192  ORF Transcript_44669/g.103192 Transcript_44669/m.103192 type:complete len:295 (-) Transcript_44669:113-997(-)